MVSGVAKFSSNDTVKKIYEVLTATTPKKIDIKNYSIESIQNDLSRTWFFINTSKQQILISVHFGLNTITGNDKDKPKMYMRQKQIYTLLNAIVDIIRTKPESPYKTYDIIFSGDFNVNMLEPFPIDIKPTFLQCASVPGQKTFIYTSRNNAPSAFGDNKGGYNPTNIDFTIFYPKVPISAAPPPTISSATSTCNHDMCAEYNKGLKSTPPLKDGACHSVMLFKTKNPDKYWSLLGKEESGYYAQLMNMVGGKIDKKFKVTSDNYYCIIDNMIREIQEEAKIGLSVADFNNIFKKEPTDTSKTSVKDYFLFQKTNYSDKSSNKIISSYSYIFYGLMGEYNTEDELRRAITPYIEKVKEAYNTKSLPHEQHEMMYLNLIDFDYNAYNDNGNSYYEKQFNKSNLPKEQTFLIIDNTDNIKPSITNKFKYDNSKDYISSYAASNFASNFASNTNIKIDELKKDGIIYQIPIPGSVAPAPSPSSINDIIPMTLTPQNKDKYFSELADNYDTYRKKQPNIDIIVDKEYVVTELNKLYTKKYYRLLNDIYYLNNTYPPTNTSPPLIFELIVYYSKGSYDSLIEYFTKKEADNVETYLQNKSNMDEIILEINKKIENVSETNTKEILSSFYKFLLETKRIDILNYILSDHDYASKFSGVIRPYYMNILNNERADNDKLLKEFKYVFKQAYGDGNCFYNSAGMQLITSVDYKTYNKLDRFSNEWRKIQYEKQTQIRNELSVYLKKIYSKIKDNANIQSNQLDYIKYLKNNGPNFDNVSQIETPISDKYWGTDDELYYIALLYNCFIIIIPPNSKSLRTINFNNNIDIDKDTVDNIVGKLINPIETNIIASSVPKIITKMKSLNKQIIVMIGGGEHWDYAIPEQLNQSGGSNTIPPKSTPILNYISKSTIKITSNKKPNKRTKTKKHENKITHKLKDSINATTTKNKKKTRKHIHKNTVITK